MTTAPRDTLGYYYDWALTLLGAESPAVTYIEQQIDAAPRGRDEQVIPASVQVLAMLARMHMTDEQVRARAAVPELY